MGIASRQLAWAMDKALEKILKSGRLPSVRELFATIPSVLGPSGPGFPFLRLRPAKPHQAALPQELTAMIRELRTDLELLFEEHHAQAQDILAAYDWVETEHRALARRLRELEEILDRMLLLNSRAAGYVSSIGDRFSSLQHTDTSQTTAWVDLVHHRVSPPIRRGVSREIPLVPPTQDDEGKPVPGNATFTTAVVSPDESLRVTSLTKALTDPAQALDGRLDTAWIQQVVLTQSTACTVSFTVDLGEGKLSEAPVTEIAVAPHALPGSTVQVSITEDGTVWRLVGRQTYQADVELAFPVGRAIRGCRVEITQQEPDNVLPSVDPEQGETGPIDTSAALEGEKVVGSRPARYEHHLGIKSLSWRAVFYEERGVLVSQPLTPTDSTGRPTPIGQVSLQAEETLHSGEIRYAISTDGVSWIPILPLHRAASTEEAVVDFRTVSSPQQVTADASTLDASRRVSYQGLDFWRLADLQIPSGHALVPGSVEAVAGYQQLALYQYVYDWGGTTPDPWEGVPDPSLANWVQLPPGLRFADDVTLAFRSATTTQLSIPHAQAHTNSRLTARVRLPKSQQLSFRLKLRSGAQDMAASLYVGNSRVASRRLSFEEDWTVTAALQEGTNTLHLLLYCPRQPLSGQDLVLTFGVEKSDGTILPLADLDPELSGADFTLTAVAPFDLFYRTPEKVYDRFAVDPETASLYITDAAKVMGIRYLVRYRYQKQDTPTQLYFKAEIEKPQEALLPPYLHSYLLMVTP